MAFDREAWDAHIAALPEVIACPGCGLQMSRVGVAPELPENNVEPFWCVGCGGTCKLIRHEFKVQATIVVYATGPACAIAQVERAANSVDGVIAKIEVV